MGYRTRVSPPGPDGGIDILAHRDELGFEPSIIKVQVKSGESSIGEPTVKELLGNLGDREYGLLVTLGAFTQLARSFAQQERDPADRRRRPRGADPEPLRRFRRALQRVATAETRLRAGAVTGR
jgi:restriction endonuclease